MALELRDYLITGRTFNEYMAFFNLEIHALRGKKILDCPSGVSSFVAEAAAKGIDAHGCDLIYQYDSDSIIRRGYDSIELIYQDTAWMKGHNFDFYGSLEGHRHHRQSALMHFSSHYNTEHYMYQTLPKLYYADKTFDLLLSSHLLFVYDDRLDLEFHIRSVQEMLRVAKEVRLFPLIDFKNSRQEQPNNFSPFVAALLDTFNAKIVPVAFEFQPRGGAMMVITEQHAAYM